MLDLAGSVIRESAAVASGGLGPRMAGIRSSGEHSAGLFPWSRLKRNLCLLGFEFGGIGGKMRLYISARETIIARVEG
jgi:hypothetical protein